MDAPVMVADVKPVADLDAQRNPGDAQLAPIYVKLRQVSKSFAGTCVLDRISLDVRAGDLLTVVGPSGCGKSTLLKLILGEIEASSGCIEIDGQEAGFADSRRGYVQQAYSLYPHLSVLQNVLLGAKLQASHWRQVKAIETEHAMAFLDRVGLADAKDHYPHELSGGMQQRVAIAQAMITRPKVLLMDEAFGALDPTARERLQMFLLDLWHETQMTIFFVTHDISEALLLGTRLLLLSQYGEQPQHGSGAHILYETDLDRRIFCPANKDKPAFLEMRNAIMQRGFHPEPVQTGNPFKATLEAKL